MMRSELTAAGIDDPRLRDGYRQCRELNAAHGRTFFLATRLLAPDQRPPVHALYGFARYADDILDDLDPRVGADIRGRRLQQLSERFFSGGAHLEDLLVAAVTDTVRRYQISTGLFEDFLASMRMDLTVTDYPDRKTLNLYMRGSAEAIGLQVLPILGTVTPEQEAAPYAAALGRAFQLTNFLRDIDEDLQRGRVYLPADELAAGLPSLHGPDDHLAEVVSFYADARKAFAGAHQQVVAVSLTERGSWSLETADGARIVLGDREQAGRRLRRFLDVYPQVVAGHATGIAYADLRYTNGFAVRWMPPAVPTSADKGAPRT